MQLLCLAHAGAGPSVFRGWAQVAPAGLQITPLSLPGREGRFAESSARDVDALVQDLTSQLPAEPDEDFALLGHSMGALLAFELTRALRRLHRPGPRHLFVSAFRAPQLPDRRPPLHAMPDLLLMAELQRMQGTPAEVLAQSELMQTLLPSLRADLGLVERYRHAAEPALDIPITCLAGVTDARVSRLELGAWRQQTTADFRLRLFPGAHFYLYRTPALVLRAVAADLTAAEPVPVPVPVQAGLDKVQGLRSA
jgi:medium-chain acyl-[acyl-carrier-protein] hydrolase